jgi:hypothetical protein
MFGSHLKYLIIFLAINKKSMYSDVDRNIPYTPSLNACPFPDWKEVFIFEINSADSVSNWNGRALPAVSLRAYSICV